MANLTLSKYENRKKIYSNTYTNELERCLINDALHFNDEVKWKKKYPDAVCGVSLGYSYKKLNRVREDLRTALSIIADGDEYENEITKIFPFVKEKDWKIDISFKKEMFDSLEYLDSVLDKANEEDSFYDEICSEALFSVD